MAIRWKSADNQQAISEQPDASFGCVEGCIGRHAREGHHADGADERLQREQRVPRAAQHRLREKHLRTQRKRAGRTMRGYEEAIGRQRGGNRE